MTTVLLDNAALADLRRWLNSNAAAGIPPTMILDLLADGLQHVAAQFDITPPERPSSPWRSLSLADDDLAPGVVIHLRAGDAGDLDLLVDRSLIVIGLRFRVQRPQP